MTINTLAGRGIGDNSATAPLADILSEDLAPDRARAAELLASAATARIENATDAGKVADLIVFLRDLEKSLDHAREYRKRPLLRDQRIIETAYGNIIGPLARARLDTLVPMHAAWVTEHPDEQTMASVAAVGSRRVVEFAVTDLTAAVGWLLENHPGSVAQAAKTILGTVIRSAGVDAVESGSVAIPGVNISIARLTQVR